VETFYATLAQICFTLVGLWWVVVQFKYEALMTSPQGRLTAYAASMHFVAPGLIALVSVLTIDQVSMWRLGSAVGSLLGIIAAGAAIRAGLLNRLQKAQELVLLILFIVLGVLSFVSAPLLGLKPLLVEALVNVAVIVLGVQFAWQMLAARNVKAG
jgi:hypothetical protein